MSERRTRIALGALSVVMAGFAIVYAFKRPNANVGPMPDDAIAIAQRLARHPADWEAASALSEHALDARVPNRLALWRAAHQAAVNLAPNRDAPRVALARSVFFHWTEMTPADHRDALAAIAPLLRDPPTFFRMARPLFELTGDLGMLRRWQPGTEESIRWLISIALANGKFADYRELRQQLVAKQARDLEEKMPRLSPAEIINAFPQPPYSADQQPLIMAVLAELHRRPLDEDPRRAFVLDALIDYALRHHLRPLDGLDLVAQRPMAGDATRLALASELGLSKAAFEIRMAMTSPIVPPKMGVWEGPDHDQVMTTEHGGPATITIERTASDEVPPYVEVYLDDVRVGEGEVATTRRFALPAAPGTHRIEVRLANALTRNLEPRRIRIVSVGP